MAQQAFKLDQKKLCCSICLGLLKDPVTIPCGHSYCMKCIRSHWDGEDQRETHSCPQCRRTFTSRPPLVKNSTLADLLEELKRTGFQAAPVDLSYAEPGDVACDFCTGSKLKAAKSCLQCLVFYCEQHLQPHYESPAFEKHKLVDPSLKLQEIVTHHSESPSELKVYGKEVKTQFEESRQRLTDKERVLKDLTKEEESIGRSADEAVSDSEKIFSEIIDLIEKSCSDVKQRIRSQQKTEASRVKELQETVRWEIAELRGETQIQAGHPSVPPVSESADSSSMNFLPHFEGVTAAVSEVRDKVRDVLNDKLTQITLTKTDMDEPKSRDEFLQYSCLLSLDKNTNSGLIKFNSLQMAQFFRQSKSFVHPDVFIDYPQVLCRESLTGRCYWEVKLSDGCIAVTYKDIRRKGDKSVFGNNNKSWALHFCYDGFYEFRHDSVRIPISGPRSQRFGVYLDHSAGILSFYSVSKIMTLLHRVQTTFTQPLYAGVGIYEFGTNVEFCNIPKN
ncbi:tripartite motif-containing protein 16-like [Archocentrus centrarchus]|uniref:tripartite motif-containing protein 16-like n=1 Tax=Archocentrus centrarchus TaxID=63155 RepID=UPI0011EA23BC|nr:tripartite motif-containing protein 16-like [Archocentrus centrarchus]XP_030597961.1 tripartite motif-containing protein 16-like [Archocentrus centrarchus]